jgi:hypothetical protein
MNQNGVLVVFGAVLLGVLGGYATSSNQANDAGGSPANGVATEPKTDGPIGPATATVLSSAAVPPGAAVAIGQGPNASANRSDVTAVTLVKQAPGRDPVTAKKKPVKKTATKSKQSEDAEARKVASACSSFLSAARAGNASSLAATMTASHREPLRARTKWASGAGMEMYREFGKNVVKTMSTKIERDKAEVRLANKTDVEGTDSQYVKSRKFNRREAFISLEKENGQWKVSGFREGMQVWNE